MDQTGMRESTDAEVSGVTGGGKGGIVAGGAVGLLGGAVGDAAGAAIAAELLAGFVAWPVALAAAGTLGGYFLGRAAWNSITHMWTAPACEGV